MDVCDKVTTEDSGAKDAVASMIKRLAHRNANVQLYTLEVSDAWNAGTVSPHAESDCSLPTPSVKIVDQRCTGSLLRELSQTLSCG